MRDIGIIVNKIINELPSDFNNKSILISNLQQISQRYFYKAPEQQSEAWWEVANLLNKYIDLPNTTWKKKIQKIFGGA